MDSQETPLLPWLITIRLQLKPTYSVKFLRPTTTTVKFKVTFDDITQLSSFDEQKIRNAILSALGSGRTRARIAQNLRAVQYVSAVTAVTDLELISIEVSLDGAQRG